MNMNALMQQAQKMQKEMEKAQKELEAKEFEIVSAGGGIKVTILGNKEIKSIDIDKEIIDPDDKEMLQDMIVVAINEAISKVIDEEQKIVAKQQASLRFPFQFMEYPIIFQNLIDCFKRLPGVGNKSAEKMAYDVLAMKKENIELFIKSISDINNLTKCPICGNMSENNSIF